THDLQRLLARQVLHARLDVYIKVLARVVVDHVDGHVIVHSADRVHQLHEGREVHQRIAVQLKAQKAAETLEHAVHAVAALVHGHGIERVHALDAPRHVHHRVPRYAHHVYRVVFGIQAAQHDGVRAVRGLVEAHDGEGIHAIVE